MTLFWNKPDIQKTSYLATFLEVQRVTEHNKQNLICAALLIKIITF